jgi:hypothetical protein
MGIERVSPDQEEKLTVRVQRAHGGRIYVDAEVTPLFCPSCRKQLPGMFAHRGSRYGQVGSVGCDHCGVMIHCVDRDNRVDALFLSTSAGNLQEEIRYADLYLLLPNIISGAVEAAGMDGSGKGATGPAGLDQLANGAELGLAEVIRIVSEAAGMDPDALVPAQLLHDPRFGRLPVVVERWHGLLKALGIV